MITITDKTTCCGCTACANICPTDCIEMKEDEEGFLYPQADAARCIHCGRCEAVCPFRHVTDETIVAVTATEKAAKSPFATVASSTAVSITEDAAKTGSAAPRSDETTAFEVQLQDRAALKESASGGFMTAISRYVTTRGGVVCGAAYDERFRVRHMLAEKEADCEKFRSSKYVQSDMGDCYSQLKQLLDTGRLCCFSGTPCQVAGLKKYLGKEYPDLITIDLVCAGVPSPALWRDYLAWQESRHGSRTRYANFRYKTYGYQSSTMRLEYENEKVYSRSGRLDPMMLFFLSGLAKRPSCFHCPFKGVDRASDLTIFDGWHAGQLAGIHDNDLGYTGILVHSKRGKELLQALDGDLSIHPVSLNEAVRLDGIMITHQPKEPPERDAFFQAYREDGFETCMNRYLHITARDRLIEALKPALHRLGLTRTLKRVKQGMRKGRRQQV